MFDKMAKIDFYSSEVIKSYNMNEKIKYQLAMLDGLDVYTRKHSENVANLTCRLCTEMGMDEGFVIYATTCAYIHDIGKMFIPPQILQKKSKLTEEEFQIMKTHTTIGYQMCICDEKLRPYLAGPYYHHESLDGTGYPQGLTAENIPYEGQIIRVADEFDAITAKRQYKSHVGITDAMEILVQNAHPTSSGKKPSGYIFKPGKLDKKIVKTLITLIIEDTEIELYHKTEYKNYLDKERERYYKAFEKFEKMNKEENLEKKQYYKTYGEGYLTRAEELDKVPQYIQDIEKTYQDVVDSENRLKNEIKILKSQKRKV